MEQLRLDIAALQSMQRFGDELETAVRGIKSELGEFEVLRDAPDCIGRHWYGMRCRVSGKDTKVSLYLHIGLIYYPTTRCGLMVELDEQNNAGVYRAVLDHIKKRESFEINRAEDEYFKLFMPDEKFQEMSSEGQSAQVAGLKGFVQDCAEAMLEAASCRGFSISCSQLADALKLCNAFDKALNEVKSEESSVLVNYKDRDNFGQYASGFRYYLSDCEKKVSLYAYFGVIYSYKKQPSGIFAEVDWFSNQEEFDRIFEHIEACKSEACKSEACREYTLSLTEPRFVKLFMTEQMTEQFQRSEYDGQIEILKTFLKACNDQMIRAWRKGEK